MSSGVIARRYAQALLQVARDQNTVEAVDASVDALAKTLADSPELRRFFQSPIISREKKKSVIKQLFDKRFEPTVIRFLHMLVTEEREDIVPQIMGAYRAKRDEELGYVAAEARVAWDISDADQQKLARRLEQIVDRKVRLTVETDPSIIGGAIVRINDTVYDGSVRHQLATLRKRLARQAFVTN